MHRVHEKRFAGRTLVSRESIARIRARVAGLAALLALLAPACVDDTVDLDGGGGPADTGLVQDAGASVPDAGFAPDAPADPDAGFAPDVVHGSDRGLAPDAAPDPDGGVVPDGGGDPCACNEFDPDAGPTKLFHSCTPPLELGCPATRCDPTANDCAMGYTCETCGAAACCYCAACVPACVFTGPAQGPLPEYLKLRNVSGTAGQEHDIMIEGFPFYVGALFYLVRVGNSGDIDVSSSTGQCRITVRAPARPPGRVPVWVSSYGGGAPHSLAGFFTYSGGSTDNCVQPGFPCGNGPPCCATGDVPVSCQTGRCRTE